MAIVIADALAGSALLLSIASPIITAAINSHAKKREREASFYLQRKAEIFEEYLQSTSSFISFPSGEAYLSYGHARGLILLLADEEALEKIIELDQCLSNYDIPSPEVTNLLVAKLRQISDLLLRSYPRLKNKRRKRHVR